MDRYLTAEELTDQLQISRALLWRLRKEGFPFYKMGKTVRFRAEDVENWLKNNANPNAAPIEAPKGEQK